MNSRQFYIVTIALIVALGGFLMGFDASIISGVVKFIEPYFNLTKIQLGWAVSCLTLTATHTMMFSGPVSDRIGRRLVLRIAAVLFAVSSILSTLAPSFQVLVIARMIGGIGVGASLIIAPMFIAEIAPHSMRGRLVSFNQLSIVIGISVAFFTNYLILKLGYTDKPWVESLQIRTHNCRWMLGLEVLPAMIYFFALLFVPRSPRWLVMKKRYDEALLIMTRAIGEDMAVNELNEIRESIESGKRKKEKIALRELFSPAMRMVMTVGIVIAIPQQKPGFQLNHK